MGLFSKKNEPKIVPPEPLPIISESGLAEAKQIMDQWDASIGNSNAMWDTLITIGRRGGYKGAQATLFETYAVQSAGGDTGAIYQRPWRWWNEAARAANTRGDHMLPGRIFLFIHFFVQNIQPHVNVGDELENGLSQPEAQYYKDIARLAVDSMLQLDPHFLIHDTATGKVDVANAIRMASKVSGVPTTDGPAARGGRPASPDDGNEWNTL